MQMSSGSRIPPAPVIRDTPYPGAELLGILADAGLIPDVSLEAVLDHIEFRQSGGNP